MWGTLAPNQTPLSLKTPQRKLVYTQGRRVRVGRLRVEGQVRGLWRPRRQTPPRGRLLGPPGAPTLRARSSSRNRQGHHPQYSPAHSALTTWAPATCLVPGTVLQAPDLRGFTAINTTEEHTSVMSRLEQRGTRGGSRGPLQKVVAPEPEREDLGSSCCRPCHLPVLDTEKQALQAGWGWGSCGRRRRGWHCCEGTGGLATDSSGKGSHAALCAPQETITGSRV